MYEETVIDNPDMGRYLGEYLREIGVEVTEVSTYMLDLYFGNSPTPTPGADFIFYAPDVNSAQTAMDIIGDYYDIEFRDLNGIGRDEYQAEFNDYEAVVPRQRF
jgi:hypothetical protein